MKPLALLCQNGHHNVQLGIAGSMASAHGESELADDSAPEGVHPSTTSMGTSSQYSSSSDGPVYRTSAYRRVGFRALRILLPYA
ncbi:hypothetical protein THAOC_09936 [Thalassiosira oceanica]|uniref:Uncharacterized protein n=1 Tax=Thalassiosira oceanica TaxID=159749 RepID=K0TE57_THAOC|nr:hypothetical protein THAOC_09936 [Thalassiosira oceanica]|eukprot:EJK68852.1 hypothetical protein THAOC_09936 [Thalassiosira oceanica]